ncbi:acetyltransferase [Xylariales sp. PMI_506]|nr:acetyltransferase [Xylariales sp. PMI_506]
MSNDTQLTNTKEYIISGCTVADGDALIANNLPAFWADPHFRLNWPNRNLEYHVMQISKRFPKNMLTGRETKRHLKAVHPDTGRIVGYVRWLLPAGFDASVWPEAVVPAVSEEDEAFFRRLASMADWTTGDTADEPLSPRQKIENEILSKKTYIQLDYLAVHPDNQGKGIATQLVAHGLEEAKKIGLDVYVMAFRPGVGLYRRLGFRIEQELILDDSAEGGPGEVYRAFMTYPIAS